jgi:hypothetical protein
MRRAVVLAAFAVLGCRSIWYHPEATGEKYTRDLFFCQHGMELAEWRAQLPNTASERAWALGEGVVPGPVDRGWKQCMVRLGWDTRVGFRSEKPWSRRPPAPPRGRGK